MSVYILSLYNGWFNITCSSMEGCLGKEVQTDLVSYLACYVFVLLVRP